MQGLSDDKPKQQRCSVGDSRCVLNVAAVALRFRVMLLAEADHVRRFREQVDVVTRAYKVMHFHR